MDRPPLAEVRAHPTGDAIRTALRDLLVLLGSIALGLLLLLWATNWSPVIGLLAGFIVVGLRAGPGQLVRRVAKACAAFAMVLLSVGMVWTLWEAMFVLRHHAFSDLTGEVFSVFGVAVLMAACLPPLALAGGLIAWIIRSWRPAKA